MKPTLLFLTLLLAPRHLLLAAEGRPNTITVFIDNMGYADFSCIRTPSRVEKTTPDNEFCYLFDSRTSNGTNMDQETALLQRAVDSINSMFGRCAAADLFAGREGKFPSTKEAPQTHEDLELVTWLVATEKAK